MTNPDKPQWTKHVPNKPGMYCCGFESGAYDISQLRIVITYKGTSTEVLVNRGWIKIVDTDYIAFAGPILLPDDLEPASL